MRGPAGTLGGAGDDYLIVTDAIARVDGGAGWDAVLADESTDATGFHFTVLGTNVELVSGRYGNDVMAVEREREMDELNMAFGRIVASLADDPEDLGEEGLHGPSRGL